MSSTGFCLDESEPLVRSGQHNKSKTRKRGGEPLSSSSATSPNPQTQQFNDKKTIAVNASRLKAARTRCSSLSCLSIFTLLSLHNLEHHIVDSLYLPTREAFLAIFVHNALTKCQSIISTGLQKCIPDEPGAPPVEPSKFTRLTTTTGNTSYIAAPPQFWNKHNEKSIDAHKLGRWLKDTVRNYAKVFTITGPQIPTFPGSQDFGVPSAYANGSHIGIPSCYQRKALSTHTGPPNLAPGYEPTARQAPHFNCVTAIANGHS